jgi:hypothetical protein
MVDNDPQSETSNDMYSEHDHPRSKSAAEQSENDSVTITAPLPPVIIITISEVLEEAAGEQYDQSRSKSPDVIVISNDSTTSTDNQAGPSNPTRDHGGTADVKYGQQQLSEAADALREALRAAADARQGKTTAEFKWNGPTEANANGIPKKSSRRSRT